MNQLTEFLVNSILEEDKKEIIGIFGGGFKPPIKGHVAIVQKALQDFPELDKLIVSVGSGVRDEIDQEESLLVWDIYQRHLPMKVEIGASKSGMPIKDIYKLAKENPDKTIYWFIGAREGREDDLQDIAARTKSADKYGNLQVKVVSTSDPNVSGTNARKALLADDKEKFFTFLPDFIADEEKEEIYTILRPAVKETSNPQDGKAAPYGSGYDEIEEKKDPKKGTGKKPKGSSRRLYTDEDPKDTVGIKFSTRQDIVDTLNKKSFKAKSHARQSQVINLIHQRVRAAYGRAKDPETKARLKRGLDYITKRKEASKEKTKRLQAQKESLNEGRYDSISRELASIALNAWKDDFKTGASYGYFVGKITPEEYPTDLTFTFKALGRFVDGEYTHNGYSKSDGEVGVKYEIPKDAIPQIWEEVYMDLISTIRHEIEHQTQGGKNVKKGKGMASDQKLRQLIKKGGGDIVRYVTLPKEIESNVQGLYLKAKKWRRPYDEVADEYIKYFLKITNPADVSYVKNKWQAIAKKRNLPSLLNENASYSSDIDYKEHIKELTKYMIEDGWNIQPLPKVVFKHGDSENARDFFGKTAYYDPNTKTIVLYTEGRHPKDIVRSFSHEMVHHEQNLEGRLGDIYTTNTQEDDRLNDIEKEANLNGTMTFRNWTDSLQENLTQEVPQYFYHATYKPLLPSIKKTGLDTSEAKLAWEDSEPGIVYLANDPYVAESYAETSEMVDDEWLDQIIILKVASKDLDLSKLHDDRNVRSDEPSDTFEYHGVIPWNVLKLYKEDINEKGFDKKLGKDPFGLNAFAYELARLDEGAYDSLTTKLTKATIQKWVEDSKKKPMPKKSFVDIDVDEFDGKGREIEFNYVGIVEFDKKIDGYEVDGTSNSGEDKGKMPFVATMFRINPKILPQSWSKISADVSDVIRHEIEHLTQAGDNTRSGKYMEDDIDIRDMINKLKILPKKNYYMLEKEVDAMLQGLYLKAKKTKKPFKDVINNYLDIAPGIETKEDKEIILNLWRSRRKALSLPVFETETGEMPTETSKLFKIFLDMDGVIVDFDKRFEEQFGMPPREFEDNFGSDKFWEKIDSKGVGFWRGMDWMPGGQQLYNRVAKHDHALLSSPSRSDLSKIGKRMWRKDNTPNTKLILARSYNKKNYADKSNILIDDRADNIQQWKDAGGIGILYQSADQVMKELDKLGL